ncbi:hypothetical protein ACQJBY_001130 [Aegilops geniculata]
MHDCTLHRAHQHPAMSPFAPPYNTNVLLAAVAALSAAIAFVAALHLYARCFLQRRAAAITVGSNAHALALALALQRPPDGYELEVITVDAACAPEPAGLGTKELGALPVLVWESSSAKVATAAVAEHCAVCLGEMEDGELGRMLPVCSHAFHVGCIDAWLRLSSTCPVCRSAVRTEEDVAAPAGGVTPLS